MFQYPGSKKIFLGFVLGLRPSGWRERICIQCNKGTIMGTFPPLLATAPLWLAQRANHRLWLVSEGMGEIHWLFNLV
jgi:hypothetical protein